MKIAYFIKKMSLGSDIRISALLESLEAGGAEVYNLVDGIRDDTDVLLSFGGDGTFLSAAGLVAEAGIPVLGVNLGRLGFLSDTKIDGLADAVLGREWKIEELGMLKISIPGRDGDFWPYALNEMTVFRADATMVGVDVSIDGTPLPTYWADGLLVSTSAGSTAYSLSVGGPICMPELGAFIVSPVSPHNLNVRPIVVPKGSEVTICPRTRRGGPVMLSLDNRSFPVPSGTVVTVGPAPFLLKRVRVGKSNFIEALQSKLHWGEDIRNR